MMKHREWNKTQSGKNVMEDTAVVVQWLQQMKSDGGGAGNNQVGCRGLCSDGSSSHNVVGMSSRNQLVADRCYQVVVGQVQGRVQGRCRVGMYGALSSVPDNHNNGN